ncbi:MAG: S-methyl-5-thioribose-1-phosphate isomerase [Dehalococcoidia bacterium]|nr:S-methyl-5-thioribose-1-phosphate isomerase [Dehalococcoidia bacterium]
METIAWQNNRIALLDQTRLPRERVMLDVDSVAALIEAIASLRVRGAPALGIAAAYGIALAAHQSPATSLDAFRADVRRDAAAIVAARPTAVNMAWASQRMLAVLAHDLPPTALQDAILTEARAIHQEDIDGNRRMGVHGAMLIPDGATVLTHCNAGALATGGYGTALGVLRAAKESGKRLRVYAGETRPLLQGARLTAWELAQDGFDVTLITDSMAGHFLHSGAITCVIVGADRIAMNGDTANKIGTYSVAVLARENGVPFYVAAPVSTLDPALPTGDGIPIEQRKPEEITHWGHVRTAPEGIKVANPAFDVTPARYIAAIITERGVARPPYATSLRAILEGVLA